MIRRSISLGEYGASGARVAIRTMKNSAVRPTSAKRCRLKRLQTIASSPLELAPCSAACSGLDGSETTPAGVETVVATGLVPGPRGEHDVGPLGHELCHNG